MKKFLGLIIFAAAVIAVCNIERGCFVFEAANPSEIFIDLNNNLILDEGEQVKLQNIYYIEKNTDYEKYQLLKQLTENEKFFLHYKAEETASNLLKNRYVKLKNGDIYIGDKSYKDLILSSKFVFDDTEISQKALIENIKSINLEDYAVLNTKSGKYHRLDCPYAQSSASYKIVKSANLPDEAAACSRCILPDKKPMVSNRRLEPVSLSMFNKAEFSAGNIKIFFIELNKTFTPDNRCLEKACRALKNEIDKAETSIDYAVYGFNNLPEILEALINAQKRGVKIRRVYDYSENKHYLDNDKLDEIIPSFKTDEMYDKNNKPALMHNKYFIFDDEKVWTGSSNVSSTDLSGFNANYAVLLNSKEAAEYYKKDFEQMYKGVFHKSKTGKTAPFIKINPEIKVKPLFSPQDDIINSEIIPLINSAEKYIYIPAFFITHKRLEEALIKAHLRGIEVKIIIDAANAESKYSVHKRLRKAGIKVKIENYAGRMHAKSIIIDDKYSIIGSMNFTKSGAERNDENVLIIEGRRAAEFMRASFNHLQNKIPGKYETLSPKAESKDSIGSCFDGIDNNFDGKTDAADEGCAAI